MRSIEWIAAAALGLLAACGDELRPEDGDGDAPRSRIEHLEEEGGVRRTRVDATREDRWVYLDLETATEVPAEGRWDLAFQRMAVISNGGVSGDGGAAVARIEGSFDAVQVAPAEGWIEDAADGDDEDDLVDSAFLGADPWYAYDFVTHTLSPQPRVYVVRTGDGNHFKLAFVDYYDDAGTSGFPTFRWSAIDSPTGGASVRHEIVVDASSATEFVAVDLRQGRVVEVPALAESTAWDIAFRRTAIRTNGGTSGPGRAAAAESPEPSLEAIVEPPRAEDFRVDELITSGRPGEEPSSANPVLATWFDYDPTTHAVSPRDARFVLRTASGDLAKLEILAWEDGVFTIDCVVAAPGAERF